MMEMVKVMFDRDNPNFDMGEPMINERFVESTIQYFSDMLKVRGYVFLKDLLDTLGIELTKKSLTFGWDSRYDDEITFGLASLPKDEFVIYLYQLKDISDRFED